METFENQESSKHLTKIDKYTLSGLDSLTFKDKQGTTYYGTWQATRVFDKKPGYTEITKALTNMELDSKNVSHFTIETMDDGRYVVGFYTITTTAN